MFGGEVAVMLGLEWDGGNRGKFEGGYESDSHGIRRRVQLFLALLEDVSLNARLLWTNAGRSMGCHAKVSGAVGGTYPGRGPTPPPRGCW